MAKKKLPKLTDEELSARLEIVIREFESADPERKNELLKSVIKKMVYFKTQRECCNKRESDLTIDVDFL